MATTDFLPAREAELVTWVNTFKALITAAPTTYGLTAADASSYGTLATNFINAYNVAQADATRSPSNIIAKTQAKVNLLRSTRQLAGIIQKFPGTTDQMRSDLGLTVPVQPAPIPQPGAAPELVVLKRDGVAVLIRLVDANSTRRGKPPGVQGARLYSFVGANPPADVDGWKFEGQITRTRALVVFPADTAPGTKVWLIACWYNPRGEVGPACDPVSAYIAGGGVPMQQAA
jgi:hypothetical protein